MAKEIKPLPPQGGSYTKKADKKKSAKPRGYRYTTALSDKLGKSETARPTSADLEKYLNKKNKKGEYVYYERRADKSDAKPKEKFAKGGKAKQTAPQSNSYNEFRDLEKKARPVGYRYTKLGVDRLKIKNPYARPSQAHIEKYANTDKGYIDYETRADKSDEKPKSRFAKGGKIYDSDDFRDWLKENKRTFYKNVEGSFLDEFIEEHYQNMASHNENFKNLMDWTKDGEYAKGGQTPAQGENYSRSRDKKKSATRVGWRYSQGLAKRLGIKNPQTKTPTQEHIDKYQDKSTNSVYWEGRADKSDVNPKAKYEGGGENEYAKGGVAEHGLRRGDRIIGVGENGKSIMVTNGDGVYSVNITNGERKRQGHTKMKSHEEGGEMEYAKGGQAESYKKTYFGHNYSKANDRQEKAKPVGYRYTEKLAKRLGKSPYAKVTPEHKAKYLGRGVYFENRKDKSDINPSQKLASGGKVKQTAPQYDSYNEFRDLTKKARPVGYRYTKLGVEKLKIKDPYARPSQAHIEKYANTDKNYIDYETRADKSDEKPKSKFEGGGENEMAKGGQARISNSEASSYAENHQPFKGNNLEAKNLENGDYVILSYGYYPIWYWNKKENKWYQNKDKFSQTTARHITASRPTYDADVVARDEMDKMMAKSLEGHGFMAMGGDVKE